MHRVVSYGLLCCAFTVHDKQKTTMEMPVLCKVTELFIHCHTCMYMQLILICSNCIRSSFPILLSNTIQACRIIFIRYCRRCINTARNLGNHCNNLTIPFGQTYTKNKLNKCTNHVHIYACRMHSMKARCNEDLKVVHLRYSSTSIGYHIVKQPDGRLINRTILPVPLNNRTAGYSTVR